MLRPPAADADGRDVHAFAESAKLDGTPTDANARAWPRTTVPVTDRLDGIWASRWNKHTTPNRWISGIAEVKTAGDRVYIWFESEQGVKHLVDTVRVVTGWLVGRYLDPLRPRDSTPWAGRIVDLQRIDGEWGEGRWDLRRRFAPDEKSATDN